MCTLPNRPVSILSNFQANTKNRFQPLSSSYTSKSTLQALNLTLKISRILSGQSSSKSSFRSQVTVFEIYLVLGIGGPSCNSNGLLPLMALIELISASLRATYPKPANPSRQYPDPQTYYRVILI
ncbi:hypothetical protein PIB30_100856 [Stylosanthes scabra]|uniref:Uncharacterized protein n=1 Tax=Stylosanthes scabra TaxID=79078 RepID=A0ABU6SXQ4_9FABA|nr:hypothetical protein [Stylosanthes scabra]